MLTPCFVTNVVPYFLTKSYCPLKKKKKEKNLCFSAVNTECVHQKPCLKKTKNKMQFIVALFSCMTKAVNCVFLGQFDSL